jgi:hypothetical protein
MSTNKRRNISTTDRGSNELKDFMKEMADKIVLDVKEAIDSQLQQVLDRMEKLEESLDYIKSSTTEMNRTDSTSATVIANTIPIPDARGRTKTAQILDLFKEEFGELTEEERKEMLATLNKAAKSACQTIGLDEAKMGLPWKALGGDDKLAMLQLVFDEARASDHRLGFLQRCTRLWACEYAVQPKWSSKSKYNRITR